MSTPYKLSDGENAAISEDLPIVLIVSVQRNYAVDVLKNLSEIGISVRSRNVQTVLGVEQLRELCPNVAFVDGDILTEEGMPFYQTLADTIPECELIILCTHDQSAYAAQAIRGREDAFDYLLIDSDPDPSRLRLFLECAQLGVIQPKSAENSGLINRHNQRIIYLLHEIRNILKSDLSSSVVKAIYDVGNDPDDLADLGSISDADWTAKYRNNLADFLYKKLRRLESEVFTQSKKYASEENKSKNPILIVEDDIISAQLAHRILKRNGYASVIASTDEKAIYELSNRQFLLVLMDIHLGEDDGLSVVKLMRDRIDLREIPVIVVTSDRHRETLIRSHRIAGAGLPAEALSSRRAYL